MIDDDIKIDCEANDENAAPTINGYSHSDEYSKRSEQPTTIKKDDDKGYRKCINQVYGTLFGGWSKRWATAFEYTCIYGKLRLCYDSCKLKDDWKHPSIHWNNVINGGKAWNFHLAYRWKFPFLKIGFNSIKNLYKENY